MKFADASARVEDADLVILGVPFDLTCSFRGGSRHGPQAIREASYNFETYHMDHGRDILEFKIADAGDLPSFASTADMVAGVTRAVSDVVRRGRIPITLGGEHSIAPAIVRAFDDVAVLGIDAHLDFRDSYGGDRWSHACSARRIGEHVGFNRVRYLGVRSYSAEERDAMLELEFDTVTAWDIHRGSMADAVRKALAQVDSERIYLTIDTDGIDPAYAPAVGNPEPFGLTPIQAKEMIDLLGDRLVGMDINEVSPAWDHGQTALLAARLVREAIVAVGETQLS